jgi:hypothetical protein
MNFAVICNITAVNIIYLKNKLDPEIGTARLPAVAS